MDLIFKLVSIGCRIEKENFTIIQTRMKIYYLVSTLNN